jgi:hypothetical protein
VRRALWWACSLGSAKPPQASCSALSNVRICQLTHRADHEGQGHTTARQHDRSGVHGAESGEFTTSAGCPFHSAGAVNAYGNPVSVLGRDLSVKTAPGAWRHLSSGRRAFCSTAVRDVAPRLAT